MTGILHALRAEHENDRFAAFKQAMEYVRGMATVPQLPRAIVVSDFARMRFYDFANDCALTEFALKAHAHLDAPVDNAYGLSPSCTDDDRVAELFRRCQSPAEAKATRKL